MTDLDFIGDIHGYSDKLEELLIKMGYTKKGKGYKHPSRKAFFVGDYIDRGPNNPRVVEIVRAMVDSDDAIALCGNHEHNAICFNFKTKNGYLREHSIKNFKQHAETMLQFQGKQALYDEAIEWFKTLPLYYESPDFNAVHATYDKASIDYLNSVCNNGILSDEQYVQLADKQSKLFEAVEVTCKGKEMRIPNGGSFFDKDKTERFFIRMVWWLNPAECTINELSMLEDLNLPNTEKSGIIDSYYDADQKPVFFGHYWLKGSPSLSRNNICCLDYSIAKKGYLAAYRFEGEKVLREERFVYV